MANEEHLEILKKGVKVWNEWRRKDYKITPDLSGANFIGAELSEADFNHTNLSWANLSMTNLSGASFFMANLKGGALFNANLSGADLRRTELYGLVLGDGEVHIENSQMGGTTFADVDLTRVKGLESVVHSGPSTIGIDTIYRSKGNIPEVFLRGAGVPEQFITYMRSLAANPIEFYSCFISCSTKDQQFDQRLHADLQNKNVRCWFAKHDMQSGQKVHEQIDQAIQMHEKLLLILSSDSMKSEWVKTEIAKARKREVREDKQVLFPVRLVSLETIRDWECFDADTGKDSAREIRGFFIPDFSDWKDHGRYQEAFERLLQDLKAGKSLSGGSPS